MVAVVVTSAAVAALDWGSVATVADLAAIPRSLPVVPSLLVPALSLAFVGLIQGAGISASYPNPDVRYADPSRDFIGQGAANVIAGVFRGMPVGGSMSATALNKTAGARSRLALMIAAVVMAITIVALAGPIGHVAMPALAGLLILVGWRTIKPDDLAAVWRSLFFAATPTLVASLPTPTGATQHAVVILRLRGRTELGTTFMGVLGRYAQALTAAGSKLVIVSAGDRIGDQLRATGITDLIGPREHLPRRRAGRRHPQACVRRRATLDPRPARRGHQPAVNSRPAYCSAFFWRYA